MNRLISIAFIFCISLISCGDDVECTAEAFNSETSAIFNRLQTAVSTYNMDPTEDNCKEFKKVAEEYLDAVESYQDCTELPANDLQQALENAQSIVAQADC